MKFSPVGKCFVAFVVILLSNCIFAKDTPIESKYIGNWITISENKLYTLEITSMGYTYQVGDTKMIGVVKQEEDRLLLVDPKEGRNDGGYCTINDEGNLIVHDNRAWKLVFTRE